MKFLGSGKPAMLPNSNKLFEDFPSFGDSTANFRPWLTGFLYQPHKINHGSYLGAGAWLAKNNCMLELNGMCFVLSVFRWRLYVAASSWTNQRRSWMRSPVSAINTVSSASSMSKKGRRGVVASG